MWFLKPKTNRDSQPAASAPFAGDQLLKDSRINSDFILGAIEDGVVMAGRDEVIHMFNPAAARITGWPGNEAVGSRFDSVLALLDNKGQPLPAAQHPFTQALATGKTIRQDCVLASRHGKSVVLSVIVTPILGRNGSPSGNIVGVFRDVTREKEEEQQRSDFISTASHEMRTPLAAIEGYLSLALNPKISQLDANAKKYVEKAETATKHLGVLFQDLLTSSRAEDGRLASYPAVVEIGETVAQVVEAERFHAKEKNLALNYVVGVANNSSTGAKVIRPLYYTFVDPHRISEVLQNIIDNAIKYTMQGSITVRLTGDPSVVQIQVSDTGAGIPEEDIPHLFQKFYRVDNTATRTVGGTGLGLFISKKIIELYNGRIWVESVLGKGSTFFINLPRLTAEQALNLQKEQAATISPFGRQM